MPAPFKAHASGLQRLADHLLFPLNMWLGEEASARLGLTPIDHERVRVALGQCRGRLLDVGCGNNLLVRAHGGGLGCDVHPYSQADLLCDSAHLPFEECSFDTVALLACLNHFTRRRETLDECFRVLRGGGRLIVTMIPRWVGVVSHPVRKPHDPDQLHRGMGREEEPGLSNREVVGLMETAGFTVVLRRRFMWGLNGLFVGEKRQPRDSGPASEGGLS